MGRKSIISPYNEEIQNWLREGISPKEISEKLKKKNVKISARSIERFRNNRVPDAALLPPSVLRKRVEGIELKINKLEEMIVLILLQFQRIDRGLQQEEDENILQSELSKEFDRAWKYLREAIEIEQGLGILPGGNSGNTTGLNINLGIQNNVTSGNSLKEILSDASPERKRDFLFTIRNAIGYLEERNRSRGDGG